MGPGPLIAIYVTLLYVFLAPLVLFGIFVLFGVLGSSRKKNDPPETEKSFQEKDPALWNTRDIQQFWEKRQP